MKSFLNISDLEPTLFRSIITGSLKEVDINDAGNDCIDLSYGTYIFKKINLYGCADKGVSVGEKSIAKINQVKLNNFHLGVVSKDSSLVEVKKMEALNLNHNQYGNKPIR